MGYDFLSFNIPVVLPVVLQESHSTLSGVIWDGIVACVVVCAASQATCQLHRLHRKTDLVVMTIGLQLLAL